MRPVVALDRPDAQAGDLDDDAPASSRVTWSGGTPSSISIARTAASQTTGAPVRLRDRGGVAVVVEGGVADEDHVGRLEVVGRARRERVARTGTGRSGSGASGRRSRSRRRRGRSAACSCEPPRRLPALARAATSARLIGTATPTSSAALTHGAVDHVDLGAPAGLEVLQHRRLRRAGLARAARGSSSTRSSASIVVAERLRDRGRLARRLG